MLAGARACTDAALLAAAAARVHMRARAGEPPNASLLQLMRLVGDDSSSASADVERMSAAWARRRVGAAE